MKTSKLINDAKNNEAGIQVEELKKILDDTVNKLSEIQPEYKRLSSLVTTYKDTAKDLCKQLNVTEFTSTNGGKVSLTSIDKSFLDPARTIEWLKQNGYERFIKTKEYFDDAEIAMAIINNELDATALAQFQVEKTEYRLNIKS